MAPTVVADPPTRAMLAIPHLAARAPVDDEAALFAAIREQYESNGFRDAATVKLDLGAVLVPYAKRDEIRTPKFLHDGIVTLHVDAVSKLLYGGRVDLAAHFANAAEAAEGYRAFMTALVAHEIVHALAHLRSVQDLSNGWLEESRAIWFEWPMLHELVRLGHIPPTWPALYVKFNRALLAAAPAGLVAQLPTDEAGRAAQFDADYPDVIRSMGRHPHPHPAKVDRVFALYSQFRLDRAAAPPVALASLAPRLSYGDPWLVVMKDLAADSRPTQAYHYQLAGTALRVTAQPHSFTISHVAVPNGAYLTTDFGFTVPAAKRAVVVDLLARIAHRTQNDAFELAPDGKLVVRGTAIWTEYKGYFQAFTERFHRHATLVERWHPAFVAVMAGKPVAATFDATAAAEDAEQEKSR